MVSHLIESMLVNDVTRLAMKVQNDGFPVKETYRRWRGILLILTHTRVVSKVPYHPRAFSFVTTLVPVSRSPLGRHRIFPTVLHFPRNWL